MPEQRAQAAIALASEAAHGRACAPGFAHVPSLRTLNSCRSLAVTCCVNGEGLLLVVRAAEAFPRIAPALTRGARRATRQLDQSLRRLTLRLVELAPLAIYLFGESLHARIGCQALGDRGPFIAVNLLDAAAARVAPLGRAGGMVALLGGADHTIEL